MLLSIAWEKLSTIGAYDLVGALYKARHLQKKNEHYAPLLKRAFELVAACNIAQIKLETLGVAAFARDGWT